MPAPQSEPISVLSVIRANFLYDGDDEAGARSPLAWPFISAPFDGRLALNPSRLEGEDIAVNYIPRPWSCGCSSSSTCTTGALMSANGKCAGVWSTGPSAGSTASASPTPRCSRSSRQRLEERARVTEVGG